MTAPVTYLPGYIEHADLWFERLWNELDWERRPDAPRREYWTNDFNRPYTYGRGAGQRTYESRFKHDVVVSAQCMLVMSHRVLLEGCFINGYENERDSLGWHADDDPSIDHSKPIAVITLGQARNIQFRAKDGGDVQTQLLDHGSLLLMHAGMQQTHLHRIPKASFQARPRVSMTFRGLLP